MSTTNALQNGPLSEAGGLGEMILRAPPFPDARPRGHATYRAHATVPARSSDDALEICTKIAEVRIGGAFWAQPPKLPRFSVLVRPRAGQPIIPVIERVRKRLGDSILISYPKRSADQAAAPVLGARDLAGDFDCWALISQADHIFAGPEDELSLLAAASGRQVHDIGSGALIDIRDAQSRFVQMLDRFAYTDPFDGTPIDLIDWISVLERWRGEIDSNRSIARVAGIKRWKMGTVRPLLWSDQPPGLNSSSAVGGTLAGKSIAVWPSRAPEGLLKNAADAGIGITRIEDGFIRSVGLGTHLVPPCSIVVDRTGMYYDPTCPSDLERILSDTEFSTSVLRRAEALIRALVAGGVTKYAAGAGIRVRVPQTPRAILVPGQVEDDQSVRLGSAGVSGNLDLLRRVRLAEPHAWIAYRPHPDVSSGLRKGHVGESEALRYADAVIADGAMSDLLDQVDGVHVLTSLAGFEALLRGREVFTHGQPFYAGWGLTRDLGAPVSRRQRRLTLLELVAGTLILYPRYLDPLTRLPCPPEVLIRRHAAAPQPRPTLLNQLRSVQGKAQLFGRRLTGAFA